MPFYRSKPRVIEAEQFTDPEKPPRGSAKGAGTLFYVGDTPIQIGDWVLYFAAHEERMTDSEFRERYESLDFGQQP